MFRIEIPWPPSVNHYWAASGSRRFITARGRMFRQQVAIAAYRAGVVRGVFDGRIEVRIEAYPPDRRRRDLDNVLKAPLDALAHAGVYADDEQIDVLEIRRMLVTKDDPRLIVTISELKGP